MHKTHIFDQKNNAKFFFTDLPTLFLFKLLQETNNIYFFSLSNLTLCCFDVFSGGCCKMCGSVEHFKKDCPDLQQQQGKAMLGN